MTDDILTKEDFRGKRTKDNRTMKKFERHYFDDDKSSQTRKAAGKRGHSRHVDDIVDEDDLDQYKQFIR